MCEQCNNEKVLWVQINGITQCQPCLNCNVLSDSSSRDYLRAQLESMKKGDKANDD